MEKKDLKIKLLPLILMALVIIIDQVSKILINIYLPLENGRLFNLGNYAGNFFEIIHVRNPGVAFSIGGNWPTWVRKIMFSAVPIVVLCLVLVVYFRNKDFSKLQRWAIAGIVGGGFGNIIDRLFRPLGVVDFIDVKWFGVENSKLSLFRMERWPTFNIADSAVVICGGLLIISFIITIAKSSKKEEKEEK